MAIVENTMLQISNGMPIGRNRKGRKGPVNARKVKFDGITFASGLERYCYQQLKKEKLFDKYEGETFTLVESFSPGNEYWAHQSNGKGDFIRRDGKKVLGISYKPDFTSSDYIIECKGRPNESFPIRFKLFRKHLVEVKDLRAVYVPKNQKDVDYMVKQIKLRRNGATKKINRPS